MAATPARQGGGQQGGGQQGDGQQGGFVKLLSLVPFVRMHLGT